MCWSMWYGQSCSATRPIRQCSSAGDIPISRSLSSAGTWRDVLFWPSTDRRLYSLFNLYPSSSWANVCRYSSDIPSVTRRTRVSMTGEICTRSISCVRWKTRNPLWSIVTLQKLFMLHKDLPIPLHHHHHPPLLCIGLYSARPLWKPSSMRSISSLSAHWKPLTRWVWLKLRSTLDCCCQEKQCVTSERKRRTGRPREKV